MLLLVTDGDVAAVATQLLEALVSEFRLLLPALDNHGSRSGATEHDGFCSWLRNFMDGLGVEQFAVIATVRYAAALAAFSVTDPDRIGRLILLGSREDASPAPLSTHRHLLLATTGLLPPESLAAVVDFLRSDPVRAELSIEMD